MREQSKDKFEEDDTNELIKKLFEEDIKDHEVSKIIKKLNQKDIKKLYTAFIDKDIKDLLALRGTIKKIVEIDKKDDKETKYMFWTVLIIMVVTFLVNIFSQKSIKEEKFKLGLFEITTKTFDESAIINFLVVLGIFFILILVVWLVDKLKSKFFCMDVVLIDLLDYIIEIKKEEEKNKVEGIKVNRSTFSEERLYIEIIEKRNRRVRRQIKGGRKIKKAPVKNTSAEK